MITLKELLADPAYKQYFLKVPKMPGHYTPDSLPWKLMIIRKDETRWRVKRFGTYKEAFDAVKKLLKNDAIYDMVINCPGLDWQPPIRTFKARVKGKTNKDGSPMIVTRAEVWKPMIGADMPTHHWCPYCRRPTVFGYFESHPAMTVQRVGRMGSGVDPTVLRCSICAASEKLIDLRQPANHQNWDLTRVRIA